MGEGLENLMVKRIQKREELGREYFELPLNVHLNFVSYSPCLSIRWSLNSRFSEH